MKKALFGLLGLLVVIALLGGGFFLWAQAKAEAAFAKTYQAHDYDFPIPTPLSEAEITTLRSERAAAVPGSSAEAAHGDAAAGSTGGDGGAPEGGAATADPLEGVDLQAIARERAVERGQHLLASRYPCDSAFQGAERLHWIRQFGIDALSLPDEEITR